MKKAPDGDGIAALDTIINRLDLKAKLMLSLSASYQDEMRELLEGQRFLLAQAREIVTRGDDTKNVKELEAAIRRLVGEAENDESNR